MRTAQLILLGAITALGSLATQIIVPALPALVADIRVTPADGQLIIAAFIIVLAASQLLWGPVADHHGRRPVLLCGILMFLGGTLACALASDLTVMLIGRTVQAIGASSALVTGRAMATDGTRTGGAAASLAMLTSVTLISPAAAPAVGGALTGIAGWRSLFWLLAAMALIGGVLAIRWLPETRRGDGEPLHPVALFRRYAAVVRGPGFLTTALGNALISSGFYLFLAVSPFLLSAAGATPAEAGLFYSIVASAIIAGTLLVPRIVKRNPSALAPLGAVVLGVGSTGVILTALADAGVPALLVAMTVVAFGSGLTGPALLAEAIERQRERAASVASLFGTLQMGIAAIVSTAVVRLSPSTRLDVALIGALMLGAVVLRRTTRAAAEPAG